MLYSLENVLWIANTVLSARVLCYAAILCLYAMLECILLVCNHLIACYTDFSRKEFCFLLPMRSLALIQHYTWNTEASKNICQISIQIEAWLLYIFSSQYITILYILKSKRKRTKPKQGCRDDAVVKSTGCSSRGSRFDSEHPHSG